MLIFKHRFAVLSAIGTLLGCAVYIMVQPTQRGRELNNAIAAVTQALDAPGATAPLSNIEIHPTRGTLGSRAVNELALRREIALQPGLAVIGHSGRGHATAPLSVHGTLAIQAAALGPGYPCRIIVSADALADPSTSTGKLAVAMPSVDLAWTYALLHEAAHCSWNPALRMERFLAASADNFSNREVNQQLFTLAQQVGESYADTYAILMLRHMHGDRYRSLAGGIALWRSNTASPQAIHETSASIGCAVEVAARGDVVALQDYEAVHSVATRCALAGAKEWLKFQRLPAATAQQYHSVVATLTELPKHRQPLGLKE